MTAYPPSSAAGATLVVHPGSLGDVVLALGVLTRLPGPVWLAARGPVLTLAGRVAGVERWLDLDGPLGALLVGESAREWPAELGGASRVVVLRADPDGTLAQRFREHTPAEVCVASARPPAGRSAHVHVAAILGVSNEMATASWVATATHQRTGSRLLIHPGSGGRTKCWSLAGFRSVALRMREMGWQVSWVVGEAERAAGLDLGAEPDVVRDPALTELAELAASVDVYLGNDSGASHLAAAVGAPSVLIFGPTDPREWAPAAPWVEALRGEPDGDPVSWGIDPAEVVPRVAAAAHSLR